MPSVPVPAAGDYPPAALAWAVCIVLFLAYICLLYTSPSPRD